MQTASRVAPWNHPMTCRSIGQCGLIAPVAGRVSEQARSSSSGSPTPQHHYLVRRPRSLHRQVGTRTAGLRQPFSPIVQSGAASPLPRVNTSWGPKCRAAGIFWGVSECDVPVKRPSPRQLTKWPTTSPRIGLVDLCAVVHSSEARFQLINETSQPWRWNLIPLSCWSPRKLCPERWLTASPAAIRKPLAVASQVYRWLTLRSSNTSACWWSVYTTVHGGVREHR